MEEIIHIFLDVILHLDKHLTDIVETYGTLTYAMLFAIVFAETGLVIAPFLPGDSLLFTGGALAALGSLNIWLMLILLLIAAVAGDTLNYWIGRHFGQKIVDNPKIPFINQAHIDKTERFYAKHGGKTIMLARFVPIVRTFAPFVAGVGKMNYKNFIHYNIVGGTIWVVLFTLAGYFFGNLPFVKDNFHYVVFAIIGLSVVPIIYEYIMHKKQKPEAPIPQQELEQIVNS